MKPSNFLAPTLVFMLLISSGSAVFARTSSDNISTFENDLAHLITNVADMGADVMDVLENNDAFHQDLASIVYNATSISEGVFANLTDSGTDNTFATTLGNSVTYITLILTDAVEELAAHEGIVSPNIANIISDITSLWEEVLSMLV